MLKIQNSIGNNEISRITADSDMGFSLGVGLNTLDISKTTGSMSCKLTYRQKYIGV